MSGDAAGATTYFLLVYSKQRGCLENLQEFADHAAAVEAYDKTERHYGLRDQDHEVVLIGADTIETVKATHGHYFSTSADADFSEFLLGA